MGSTALSSPGVEDAIVRREGCRLRGGLLVVEPVKLFPIQISNFKLDYMDLTFLIQISNFKLNCMEWMVCRANNMKWIRDDGMYMDAAVFPKGCQT